MAPPPKKKRKCTSRRVTRSISAAAAVLPTLPESTDIETPNSASSTTATSSARETARSSTPPRPPPPNSPNKCAICQGDLVNSCYTNKCMHQFCFACLLEWSKVKPECPLCKSLFKSIYHNVRSNDEYDEYIVPSPIETLPSLTSQFSLAGVMFRALNHVYSTIAPPPNPPARANHDHGYSFSQFTSNSQTARDAGTGSLQTGFGMSMSIGRRAGLDNPFYSDEAEWFESVSMGPTLRSRTPSPTLGHAHRRRIYDRGQHVRAFNASTMEIETELFPSSVEYLQAHPESFYPRVSEWLHRELTVLIGLNYSRNYMANIYDRIFTVLFRYEIRSVEFHQMIHPYLNNRTHHFQREFYNFVMAGMSIEEYDRLAVYTRPTTGRPSPAGGESSTAISHSDEPAMITITNSEDEDNEVQNGVTEGSNPVRGETGSDMMSSGASVIQNQEIALSDDHEIAHEGE